MNINNVINYMTCVTVVIFTGYLTAPDRSPRQKMMDKRISDAEKILHVQTLMLTEK